MPAAHALVDKGTRAASTRSPRAPWGESAACQSVDPALFFHPDRKGNAPAGYFDAAREVCAICTVSEQCLAAALELREEHDLGIRAGTLPAERRILRSDGKAQTARG